MIKNGNPPGMVFSLLQSDPIIILAKHTNTMIP